MLNVFTALGGLYSVIVDETCFLVQWTYFAFPSFSVFSNYHWTTCNLALQD